MLLEPNPKVKSCQLVTIPISYNSRVHKKDTSMRKALKECYPDAVTCKDLTKGTWEAPKTVKPRVTRSVRQAAESALFAGAIKRPCIKTSLIPIRKKTVMSALLTFACLTMVNSQQYEHGYVSELAPVEPKSQREASNSPHSAKWK